MTNDNQNVGFDLAVEVVRRAATDLDEVTGIQDDGLIADRERDLAVQDEKTFVEITQQDCQGGASILHRYG